jgi:hypothetical protein
MPHFQRTITAGRCLTLLLGAAATFCPPAAAGDLSGVVTRAVATARRPAPPAVKLDPAVVPAGGAGCCSVNNCDGQVRQAGFHHGHAHGCRDGMCVPSCPVRPGQFGYYGTQWRRWPGQGIIQTSAAEAATPVKPPRSAVPGAEEESPTPPDGAVAAEPQDSLDEEPQRGRPRAGDDSVEPPEPLDPAEPLAPEGNGGVEPAAKPLGQPQYPQRDSAAINTAGPWSRMVAATSLPPGYEPPQSGNDSQ